MTTIRQIEANRNNSKSSIGPRTATGKSRAAQNAHRHGLSLPVIGCASASTKIESLARRITGKDANATLLNLARKIAEAQIDLLRVRQARHDLLVQRLSDPNYRAPAGDRVTISVCKKMFRLVDIGAPIPMEMMNFISPMPEGPGKFATILCNLTKELIGLDRYERRALSRRKFAIRDFDAATAVEIDNAKNSSI